MTITVLETHIQYILQGRIDKKGILKEKNLRATKHLAVDASVVEGFPK
jgi:hypothetical protein